MPKLCIKLCDSDKKGNTAAIEDEITDIQHKSGGWFSWTRQSDDILQSTEKKILSCVKTPYRHFYVDIGSVMGQSDKIWTLALNEDSPKTPIVLLHGMGAGSALWCPNLEALVATRPVYAIDLLGFGRSTRPKFDSDAVKAEAQWVESIEEWRRQVNLSQFILLGHSLGGFLCTAYAIKYPERVRHLVLADPWGFPEKPPNVYESYQMPLWVRPVFATLELLNPMWAVRAAGPAGKWVVSKNRAAITKKYVKFIADAEVVVPEYLYQCNSQPPSGETAFHTLMTGLGWAKNPMVNRLDQLDKSLPITAIFGSQSWLDKASGQVITDHRPSSITNVQVIDDAGHHVYLDKPELFNKFVLEACAKADEQDSKIDTSHYTSQENGWSERDSQSNAATPS